MVWRQKNILNYIYVKEKKLERDIENLTANNKVRLSLLKNIQLNYSNTVKSRIFSLFGWGCFLQVPILTCDPLMLLSKHRLSGVKRALIPSKWLLNVNLGFHVLPQCIFIICYLLKIIYLVQNGEKLYFSTLILTVSSLNYHYFATFKIMKFFKQITKSIGKISNMSTMVFFEEIWML